MRAGPRYVVREIDGYSRLDGGGKVAPQLSVSVLDSACCWQELARWNQEQQYNGGPAWQRRARIRRLAHELAARLNEQIGPP